MQKTTTHSEQLVTINEEPNEKLIRGFMFACTQKSETECLTRLIFATDKNYGPVVIRIRKGDLLFLNNLDTDTLFGIFRAVSDGSYNIEPSLFQGKYRYQVKVAPIGEILSLPEARKIIQKFRFNRNIPLSRKNLADLLDLFLLKSELPLTCSDNNNHTNKAVMEQILKIRSNKVPLDIEEEIPLIESTTFWDFPRQSYGVTPKGNNKYAGVTPALIIYNLLWRYTDPSDLVLDPMCGSGTTLDVCLAEKRRAIGYDIASTRPDIIQNDARNIPLSDDSVDMVFIDSPYGDNIKYNEHSQNIGNISSESDEFYDELEKVMRECHRVMKDSKALGWLIGDQWVKKVFTPVGLRIYERLCKYFEPVDIICVSRRGQSSNTDVWHNRARRYNFYLRGFKYLIIVRKNTNAKSIDDSPRKIEWARYKR